jgi:toxic protein SymE
MGGNPYSPLTTTNSLQELIMANANLKPRRTRDEHVTRISVALEEVPATGKPKEQGKRLAFPWMQITDTMLEHAGFLPGNQVLFSIDYRYRHTITPDYDYLIAGRYMTAPEAEATRQRLSRRN